MNPILSAQNWLWVSLNYQCRYQHNKLQLEPNLDCWQRRQSCRPEFSKLGGPAWREGGGRKKGWFYGGMNACARTNTRCSYERDREHLSVWPRERLCMGMRTPAMLVAMLARVGPEIPTMVVSMLTQVGAQMPAQLAIHMARWPIDHGPVAGHGPQVGDPCCTVVGKAKKPPGKKQ